jgi:diguanylate cyclase (GGDEF)-like protein
MDSSVKKHRGQIPHWRSFLIRHRKSLLDISMFALVLLVGLYLAFEYDFFVQAGQATSQQKSIELDEVLLVSGTLALTLLIFSIRRYQEQKRETARRIEAEQYVRVLAFQDSLTGLANRRQFDDALKAAVASPPREGAVHAVFLLDLNGFKQVNDTHGHGVGDEVLTITAQRLLQATREGDLVARFGGDEFAILSQHLLGAEAATSIALRIIDLLKDPVVTGSLKHDIRTGIGIALIPNDSTEPSEVLRMADLALYRAKEERQSAVRFFEHAMDQRVQERNWLENELRAAVAAGDIHACFQPSVQLDNKSIVGFEATPRWIHREAGEILPSRFLPIAEESGLIHKLADQILQQACTAAMHWPQNLILSIDLLPIQLKDGALKDRILQTLHETGLSPNRLEIEITESALVRDLDAAQEVLGALRETGVRIALDNFGTGYSSLYHLRNFKLDKIKIDSGFVRSMLSEQESAEIVRALVGLAHGLGLTIAAEGIQNPAQQTSLMQTGCQQGQGNLYSELMSAEQTYELFTDTRLTA